MSPDDLDRLETLTKDEWIEILLWFIRQLWARLAAINDRTHLG